MFLLPPRCPQSGVSKLFLCCCHRTYGWSVKARVHWIVPILGTRLIGLGSLFIIMPAQIYLDGSLRRLHASGDLDHIDLLFINHYKPTYTYDLKLCEELKLVRQGSTVAANNVVNSGALDYLAYMKSSVEKKREKAAKGETRETGYPSNRNWYLEDEQRPTEKLATHVLSDPDLIYDMQLMESFEPNGILDGIEVSIYMGRQA